LAKRDTVWMGQIYQALGLSVGCIVHEAAFIYDPEYNQENTNLKNDDMDEFRDTVGGFKIVESFLQPCSRKQAYSADITYGTNHEFGFDYLRDNMVYDLKAMVQRGFNYVIIDEVDSVLIDEARTPLIISAPDVEAPKMYHEFAKITPHLKEKGDYEIDEKARAVTLTEQGINKIEKILKVENIYEDKGIKYLHHLEQALRAETLFKKDRDYVVIVPKGESRQGRKEGKIVIIDEFTGRLMPGRRWSSGLHQAVEAKEGVDVQPESMTLATISFQNYFRKYKKLAGMTGTAATSAEEFHKVYGLDVVIVPTNLPMNRHNLTDFVYKNNEGKLKAIVEEIKKRHTKGQPILIGTRSVEKNEHLGRSLNKEGITYQILNAKNHAQEGEIIAQAGKLGKVTVATNMAGRGVDIILGGNPLNTVDAQKVKELGGLHVIGTERHEARRIDDQLRGRSGRQGDPGSSQFFVSLEDDLMRIFGGDKVKSVMETLKLPEDQPIQAKIISGIIEKAQANIEGMNFDVRKHLLDYDDVMSLHRETFYKKKKDILKKAEAGQLRDYVLEIIKKSGSSEKDYEKKEKELGTENMRQLEKIGCLRVLDSLWIEHLENMEYLRDSVRLRAYGQKDPLVEYKKEGYQMFQKFLATFEISVVQAIFRARLAPDAPAPLAVGLSTKPGKKPGRNDPCPCGSGKKFKKCCMLK